MDRSAPFGSDDIPENDDQIVVSSPRDSTMSDVEQASRRIEMLEEKLLEARGALAQSTLEQREAHHHHPTDA
jgi:hypothetical protein